MKKKILDLARLIARVGQSPSGDPMSNYSIAVLKLTKALEALFPETEVAAEASITNCPNCKEPIGAICACFRNKCIRCGDPVGNITFTVCDKCWDKEHGKAPTPPYSVEYEDRTPTKTTAILGVHYVNVTLDRGDLKPGDVLTSNDGWFRICEPPTKEQGWKYDGYPGMKGAGFEYYAPEGVCKQAVGSVWEINRTPVENFEKYLAEKPFKHPPMQDIKQVAANYVATSGHSFVTDFKQIGTQLMNIKLTNDFTWVDHLIADIEESIRLGYQIVPKDNVVVKDNPPEGYALIMVPVGSLVVPPGMEKEWADKILTPRDKFNKAMDEVKDEIIREEALQNLSDLGQQIDKPMISREPIALFLAELNRKETRHQNYFSGVEDGWKQALEWVLNIKPV